MAGLQVLEDHYGAQGLSVAGFYSNNFGKQGGSPEQIVEVTEKYGVKHDQYALAPVVGDDARPLFKWLLTQPNPGPKEGDIAPTWNFYKWVVSRSGKIVAAYDNRVYAGRDPSAEKWTSCALIQVVEAELAK